LGGCKRRKNVSKGGWGKSLMNLAYKGTPWARNENERGKQLKGKGVRSGIGTHQGRFRLLDVGVEPLKAVEKVV